MTMIRRASLFAAIFCGGAFVTSGASADFYKGRTLNVVINFGAGGNTDVQARSLMRHMEKYIAGNPRIVIRNMPGAGGVVGANYMNQGARTDGTFMGVFTTPWMHELSASGALTASLKNLIYIGAISQQNIAHVRKDVGPGINSLEDFVKLEASFKSAGHAPTSSKDIAITVTLRMLGMQHEHVVGFASAGPIRRAIMQNEVQYTEDSEAGYYGGVFPNLIEPGISIPLWQNGELNDDGLLSRSKAVPNYPTFTEAYQLKFGKDARPSGPDWEVYKRIAAAGQFLRTVVMPPGAPDEAVKALRAAWLEVVKDKDYLAEYQKANNSPLEWRTSEQAEKDLKTALDISQELRDHLQKIAGLKK